MEKIIIDTDPGIDDAIAILLAIHSKKFELKALTTVCGNCSLEKATKNALKILNIAGENNIPIYEGAKEPLEKKFIDAAETHGDDGMGSAGYPEVDRSIEKEYAPDYLVKVAKENKGDITLLPIGPLTNIALAVKKDANFAKNIKRLVIMGGAEGDGNCSPVAEFNFWEDPHAAKIVFEAGFNEIIMVGLNATRKIVFTPNLREVVKQFNTPLGNFIYDITKFYIDFHWEQERTLGCVINDPLVVAYLLDENVISLKDAYVDIAVDGICEGQSVVDNKGFWHNKVCNAKVAYNSDPRKFFEIFFNILFPNHKEDIKIALEKEFN